MRAWTGLIRTATVLAPLGILLFWGGSYLLACAEYLANPGVPLRIEYRSPAGIDLLITADSYVYDTRDGDLTVVKPRVTAPDGTVLLYADRVDAYDLPVLATERKRAVITARNAYATIRRKPDGMLDLFDYLPKREGPSGDFPFTVTLDRGRIKFIEETGPQKFVQNISLTEVAVEGVGDRWVASGNATLSNLGDVNLSIQNQPDSGSWFRGSTDRLEVATLFRAFRNTLEGRRTPVLRDIDADSLVIKGPFEIFIPSEAGARFQAAVVADATDFRYGREYFAQNLSFDGVVSAEGGQGRLIASNAGLDVDFSGVADWEKELKIDGSLEATAANMAAVPAPIRNQLPRQIAIQGPIGFDGRLGFADAGVVLNGVANGASVTAFDEVIASPVFVVDYSAAGLTLSAQKGSWRGSPFVGSFAIDRKTNRLSGSVNVAKLNLGALADRFNIEGFTGVGAVDVLLAGTTQNPVAYIRSVSSANYKWSPRLPAYPGRLTLAATLRDDRLVFDQAYMVSTAGSISASGSYNIGSKQLNLVAVGSGIDLERLDPRLEGIGRFRANIGGTLNQPRYQGTAELFGLYIQDQAIPILTGTFSGDRNSLTATNLNATKGASSAQGEVRLRFSDMALDGRFQAKGVQLNDFLGQDYLATIDLPDARLGGTFAKPTFNATATADAIVILGSRIDSAKGVVTYKNDVLQVDDIVAQVGGGSASGYLSYDVSKARGNIELTAKSIPLDTVSQIKATGLVTADISGDIGITFASNGIVAGSAEGTLDDITLRDTAFGAGNWNLKWSEGRYLSGDVFFGGLASSVDLTRLQFDKETREVSGNAWIRNVPADDLYKIFRPYLPNLPDQATILLDQTEGVLGISADVGGVLKDDLESTLRSMNLANAKFDAANLLIGGRPGGNMLAEFSRRGNLWTIGSLNWSGGPVGIAASGTYTEHGPIDIEGNINDADLTYLNLFEPSFSSIVGKIDSRFSISGTTENPVLVASPFSDPHALKNAPDQDGVTREIGGIGFKDVKGEIGNVFNFVASPITVSNWNAGAGGAVGSAKINYQGYSGTLDFNVPFRFPFEVVPDREVSAKLTLDNRQIRDIQQLTKFLDPEKSVGVVGGEINFSGSKENFTAGGTLGLTAERLVFQDGGQELNQVSANVHVRPGSLSVDAAGSSAQGGTFKTNAEAAIPSIDEILKRFTGGTLDSLFTSPLVGQLVTEELASKASIGPNGLISSRVSSNLTIGGTLKNPAIRGTVELANGVLTLPTEESEQGAPFVLPGTPLFDILVRTTTPFKFKSSTADIDMSGSGTVQGTPDDLELDSQFRVDRGVLRLPTARLNIEPGGIITPTLRTFGSVVTPRLDVELEGKTRVVAPARFGEGAQAYDIRLDVRGDLLEYGGLSLSATSDPPDLSQDEIFALLGQLSIIEGLASGVQSGNAESNIREAFFGIAVPYLLDPITGQIASTLGLDYLTVNISALDGATIYFAKTIGRNLILQGSRQVTQVNQNYPIKYDLRVAYQMRFGSRRDRRRLNFIVGLDEVRPWKIAIEYTFRF
jgi:hypothetical protein